MSRKLARTNTAVLTTAAAEREAREAGQGYGRKGPVVVEVDIDRIVVNPHQPRQHFDDAEMQALTASIAQHGLAQPVGVQQLGDGRFQLVFGERRYRAVKALGHATIYAVTVSGAADELALIENVVRADLSPFEEGDAFARLMEQHGYRQEDVGKIVGKDRVDISRALIISRLPQQIRDEYPVYRPARYRLVKVARSGDETEQLAAWEALKAELAPAPDTEAEGADIASGAAIASTKPAKATRTVSSVPAGTALPKTLAKAIHGSRRAFAAVREQGASLAPIDREALQAIRDEIDAILAADREDAAG